MTYDQKRVVKTILRRLAKLQNSVKNPDMVELLNNASFELFEIIKVSHKFGNRYSAEIKSQVARMYEAGIPIKSIKHSSQMNEETIRRIAIDLGLPRRYNRKMKEMV